MAITYEQQESIKSQLASFIKANNAKPKSAKARSIEDTFLVGVFSTLTTLFPPTKVNEMTSAIPPHWALYRVTGRSILDK